MKKDPTKTKMLRISYEKHLIRKYKQFMKMVIPRLTSVIQRDREKILSEEKKHLATAEFEAIIDDELYYSVEMDAPYDAERYLGQGYKRGKDYAINDIKKATKGEIIITPTLMPLDIASMNILRDNNVALIKNIGQDVKKNIVRVINEGILQGHGVEKIARNIKPIVEPTYKNRSKTIARTEISRAYNTATSNKYKDAGIKKYEWLCADPCPLCEPNCGQYFPVGGDRPPLHPNCVCGMAAVVEE